MSSVNNATQDLLWIARRFKGVVDLIPQLEALGSLENSISEYNIRLRDLQAQAETLSKANTEAKLALEASRKAQEATLQETKARVAEIEAQVIQDAQRAREKLTEIAQQEVDKARAEKDSVLKLLATRKATLEQTDREIVKATEQLNRIRSDIESLKAKF